MAGVDQRDVVARLAEVQVVAGDRAAGVLAAAAGLRRRVQDVAVDDEVAVVVGPGSGHARHDLGGLRRVVQRVPAVVRRRRQIVPEVELDRRLAVAEHVVGGAEARRDVVERVDPVGARERDRRGIEPRRDVVPLPSAGLKLHARSYRSAPCSVSRLRVQVSCTNADCVSVRSAGLPHRQPERELVGDAVLESIREQRVVGDDHGVRDRSTSPGSRPSSCATR